MNPPILARALVAIAAARDEYECVAGDLLEEYAERVEYSGRAAADRWYWSQAVRSVPALLTLSRSNGSFFDYLRLVTTAIAALAAMLVVGGLSNGLLDGLFGGSHAPLWLHFAVSWSIVAATGYALGSLARGHGVRLALETSLFFVVAFAVPSALRISSPLYPLAWVLLIGVIPSMTFGASLGRAARRT